MAKRSFYRAANAILGKIGGRATEDVILQLIHSKCLPALLYGLEACPLRKADSNSLDFVVNRLLTTNIDIVNYCRTEFQFELPCIVLHCLLPPRSVAPEYYELRQRSHNRALPTRTGRLTDSNFINRLLFKDIY